ncbi:hypothetical protein GCM10010976_33640 [Bizionia arctica]|uniref:Glycosyltransferase n=1 Tax=Bizionia arctica TaxID=1495645 RepID=A0A917GX24_9FLAO|nr:hypothetical protein GCM10010976_33640 [Bizionia arctica]
MANDANVELTILSGAGRDKMGDQEIDDNWKFEHIKINVSKKDFGKSKIVRNELKSIFDNFDWVLIPAEKKNLLLLFYALKLKKNNPSVQLFSYNHPILKSKNGKITFLDKLITKIYYKKLDRVIFYTKQSCDWAISKKLINSNKAFWANNTIDNTEIAKFYSFHLPPNDNPRIVFIGRLIASKKIEVLLEYYRELKLRIPNLKLDIIGDGPEKSILEPILKVDIDVFWHGTLVDESKIAPIMSNGSLVFVPGHSGLSINHAFAYGRPYITLKGLSHAPELDYIDNEENGYVLAGDFKTNIDTISKLLINANELERFCVNAKQKGASLSVQKWVNQLKSSLLHE